MKLLYKNIFLTICIVLSLSVQAQEKEKDNSNQDRDRAEKSTAPFSLNYFNKPGNSYLVLTLQVKEGKLVADERTKVQEVKGKMPYPTGNLSVRVLDAQGELLDQYQMQDPLVVRSCEDEKSETKPVTNGTVQIMLPPSGNIATIELLRDKQTVQRISVKALIDEYRRGFNPPKDEDDQ